MTRSTAARLRDNTQGLAWNLFNRSFAALPPVTSTLAIATARRASRSRSASTTA